MSQRLVEIAQRLQHEGDAVRGGETRAEQRLVEDEQWHDPLRLRRGAKRRVVPHTEIAVEENDRGLHFAYGDGMSDSQSGREESEGERLDRNLNELLQELRVALPGVQVLFAFLLAVPFQQNFSEITPFQERVYFATLLLTALSAALLISPSAYHRMTFRMQQKDHLIFLANKLAIAGLGCLALAMTGAIMLITDVLFGTTATIFFSAASLAVFVSLWYALPLRRRFTQGKT